MDLGILAEEDRRRDASVASGKGEQSAIRWRQPQLAKRTQRSPPACSAHGAPVIDAIPVIGRLPAIG